MATEDQQTGSGEVVCADGSVILHATTVAVDGRAALITGRSGAGKSALALQLMAFGAELISDDRTKIARRGARLVASAPDTLRGAIEARGVGILSAAPGGPGAIALIVDLDGAETERLPHMKTRELLGVALPLLLRVDAPHFASAVLQWLKAGRIA